MAARAVYLPTLDPHDPDSLPHGASGALFVPLLPDRRGRAAGRRWLRRVGDRDRVWAHTCVRDRILARLERLDPLGLRLAGDVGAHGVVTPDVPLYGTMTTAQRERAEARQVQRLLHAAAAAERDGLEVLPLVKALDADGLARQLDLVVDQGLPRAALYAREFLLERQDDLLRRFVRGAHRRGLGPVLLGATSPGALRWGPACLVGHHHYVLARRGVLLDPRGRRTRLKEPRFCRAAGRFLLPGDHRSLGTHNLDALRTRLTRALAMTPLEAG